MFGTTTGRQDQQAGGKSSSVVACNGGYSSREEASATDGELPQIVAAPPINFDLLPPPMFGTIIKRQAQQAGGRSSSVLECGGGDASGEDTDGELPQMEGTQSSQPESAPRLDMKREGMLKIGSVRGAGVFGAQAQEGSMWNMFSWMPASLVGGDGGSHDPLPRREQPQAPQRIINWRTCDSPVFCEDQEERLEDMGQIFSRPPHVDAPAPSAGRITVEEYLGLMRPEKVHVDRIPRAARVYL